MILRRRSKGDLPTPGGGLRGPRSMDDPEWAEAVACRGERNNLVAIRNGLPAIGSKWTNRAGIEWLIDGHLHVRTADASERIKAEGFSDADLYPIVIPQNLSDRLLRFMQELDRCTTKHFLIFDTVPHLRYGKDAPMRHYIDTVSDPDMNLVFLDMANVSEHIFAHELAHAWVQYVDECEDDRVLHNRAMPELFHQVSHIQSFVLDLKVDEVLESKGFDTSESHAAVGAAIETMAKAFEARSRPNKCAEVFLAIPLANQMLMRNGTVDNKLTMFNKLNPDVLRLAQGFARAVEIHGYSDHAAVVATIDRCLKLAFDHSSDELDFEKDFVTTDREESEFDKYPNWLPHASPRFKCEIGKVMARNGIPIGTRLFLRPASNASTTVEFHNEDGSLGASHRINLPCPTSDIDIERLNEINRDLRERAMNKQNSHRTPLHPHLPKFGPRFYMPDFARFITQAMLEMQLAGESRYGYALNSPTTYTDPTGLTPCPPDPCLGCDKAKDLCAWMAAHETAPPADYGSVACCGSRAQICINQKWLKSFKKIRSVVKRCTESHEHLHIEQFRKGEAVCYGSFGASESYKCGYVASKTIKDRSRNECAGFGRELQCIMKTWPNLDCKGTTDTREECKYVLQTCVMWAQSCLATGIKRDPKLNVYCTRQAK